jgi:hypothetical protein
MGNARDEPARRIREFNKRARQNKKSRIDFQSNKTRRRPSRSGSGERHEGRARGRTKQCAIRCCESVRSERGRAAHDRRNKGKEATSKRLRMPTATRVRRNRLCGLGYVRWINVIDSRHISSVLIAAGGSGCRASCRRPAHESSLHRRRRRGRGRGPPLRARRVGRPGALRRDCFRRIGWTALPAGTK